MSKKIFVLAPDSFKESMTAKEVCIAMEKGIKKALPEAKCIHVPMADGGEGTVQSLVDATHGQLLTKEVTGPLETKVMATYGILGDGKTAVIEMASASGIEYVNSETKNPLVTTTYGTGELIMACLEKKVTKLILGIGGSATNDGGAGMAEALGAKLLDAKGNQIPHGGGGLGALETIDVSKLDERLNNLEIIVACDVTNPLCGETGASNVFGPQKGATKEMIATLDANLARYAQIAKEKLCKDVVNVPGAGAAGGLGAGLLIFANATLKRGIEIVIDIVGLKEKMHGATFCFTGEGGIDFQTKFGKTPYGVAQIAKAAGVPVVVVAGYVGEGIDELYGGGIDAVFGILPRASSLEEALKEGPANVERTCENITRLILSKDK